MNRRTDGGSAANRIRFTLEMFGDPPPGRRTTCVGIRMSGNEMLEGGWHRRRAWRSPSGTPRAA